MSENRIEITHTGPLAIMTMNSPPLNLFDTHMFEALAIRMAQFVASPPRGLLIRARGRVVSGGVDVADVFDGMSAETGAALWESALKIVHQLEELPCPTVFAAHGL